MSLLIWFWSLLFCISLSYFVYVSFIFWSLLFSLPLSYFVLLSIISFWSPLLCLRLSYFLVSLNFLIFILFSLGFSNCLYVSLILFWSLLSFVKVLKRTTSIISPILTFTVKTHHAPPITANHPHSLRGSSVRCKFQPSSFFSRTLALFSRSLLSKPIQV